MGVREQEFETLKKDAILFYQEMTKKYNVKIPMLEQYFGASLSVLEENKHYFLMMRPEQMVDCAILYSGLSGCEQKDRLKFLKLIEDAHLILFDM